MKVDPNQTDLYLCGIHYIRKDANEPRTFASEYVTEKYDLDGNLIYEEVLEDTIVDLTPNT